MAATSLPLSLLVLVCHRGRNSSDGGMSLARIREINGFLNRDAHVATVTAFATIPFVLADAPFDTNTSILASSARALAITTLLALPAALAARLGRQVFLIGSELMLEVDRRHRSLAGWGRTDHPGRGGDSSGNRGDISLMDAVGSR